MLQLPVLMWTTWVVEMQPSMHRVMPVSIMCYTSDPVWWLPLQKHLFVLTRVNSDKLVLKPV